MEKSININFGMPCFLLFVVFLVLKLTNVIAWSWLWVTAPIWIPLALLLVVFIIIGIIANS
jgi:hypothetical protein